MAQRKGLYGSGTIAPSGKSSWRIRYRLDGQRFAKTIKGSRTEAARELRRLLHDGDTGQHVAPDRVTFAQWVEQWLTLKERTTEGGTTERYAEILKGHIVPALGAKALQKITATDLDTLYAALEKKLAPGTMTILHVVVKSCLKTAVRKKLLGTNPADDAEKPKSHDSKVGRVLDGEELTKLVHGFRGTSVYGIVAVAAYTGMRRNEILALRWVDIDFGAKTISITRSIDEAWGGRNVKGPKSKRGVRDIEIDIGLLGLLRRERERHLRITAGIPDGADADLSLIKLPSDALVFPAIGTSLTSLRCPNAVTKLFVLRARKIGFPGLRFHDLRGSHGTWLLDQGQPVHTVAKRLGHDPAMLLRAYAKRTKKSDTSAANVIGTLTSGVL
jgi:integrase